MTAPGGSEPGREAGTLIARLDALDEGATSVRQPQARPADAVRAAIRTRGALRGPGPQPASSGALTKVLADLAGAAWAVRCEVAQALGARPGLAAATALQHLAREDPEWRVRDAAAEALGTAGGLAAVETLAEMVDRDPHPQPASRALDVLARLALEEGPVRGGRTAARRSAVRTRGAVRARSSEKGVEMEAGEKRALQAHLEETLDQAASPAVRAAAREALARLR